MTDSKMERLECEVLGIEKQMAPNKRFGHTKTRNAVSII